MSDQENVNVATCHGSPVVVVESLTNKRAPLYRTVDSQDIGLPDSPQKRVSGVTSVTSERHKLAAKKLSSNINRRDSAAPVTISMVSEETEAKMDDIVLMAPSTRPKLPSASLTSPIPSTHKVKEPPKKIRDEDSITSEVVELTSEKEPYWSPEEEGGLPRDESQSSRSSRGSRGSRVPRVVRQLFCFQCCGVQIEPPDEDNVSSPRDGVNNSGI